MNIVGLIVTGEQTGSYYWAQSYPSKDRNKNGYIDYYRVPVYKLRINQYDKNWKVTAFRDWTGLRFMPYYNDPKSPNRKYKSRGFLVAGLSNPRRGRVRTYKSDYRIQNTVSPFDGAIVITGAFYIHAGPQKLSDWGWGSAGCVEVIGNFDGYKKDIAALGGVSGNVDDAIAKLVSWKKLYYDFKAATPPKLRVESGH
ncbi:hypothetical protein AB1L42_11125 [Thalassoglobus sp. JC818]|uniref:hypothetical protein n=1 Tax=Thalassoglobus sp. JC818 TaxID=3232136 RepID=UPI00345B0498